MLKQLRLTPTVPLPDPTFCPVEGCPSVCFWEIYSGSDTIFTDAHIAECRNHGLVAYRLAPVCSSRINIIPFALTTAERACKKRTKQPHPCVRCGAKGMNQECLLHMCKSCCYGGRKIRCECAKHDKAKGDDLAHRSSLAVHPSKLYALIEYN
ncbi:hypothetical protein AURDEDRAFT_124805 [Auricularia subglabra TFB-10046 SS5]|nr:hypothetical protein AURDEDRAFT_124805 [Auricularia subglabra TFB-10046 SS5]